jgi:agmatine/peptidylarginine deiminase
MISLNYAAVSKVLIAYPERYYNVYDELVPFYDELISILPNNVQVWVITNNNQTIEKLELKFAHKKIGFVGIKGWDEIWLQDCLGIIGEEGIIKPIYAPNYCFYESHSDYLQKINKLSRRIIKECLAKDIIDFRLNLDCGNFVHNKKFCFLTDKVLEQNSNFTINEIEEKLEIASGLKPIIIKGNKSDSIGHTDAYLTFIDHNRAVMPSYPSFPFLKEDIEFIQRLEEKVLECGIEVIKMYDRPIYETAYCGCNKKKSACFYSARGNYINFLKINNLIILPEYTLATKKETDYYNRVNQEILEDLGFEIKRINCDMLSKLGGVLHCMSLTA